MIITIIVIIILTICMYAKMYIYIYVFICILNGYFNSNIIHTWWTQTMNLPFGDDISTYLHALTVVSGMVCFWGLTRLAKNMLDRLVTLWPQARPQKPAIHRWSVSPQPVGHWTFPRDIGGTSPWRCFPFQHPSEDYDFPAMSAMFHEPVCPVTKQPELLRREVSASAWLKSVIAALDL